MAYGLAGFFVQRELQSHALGIIMTAAEAVVLARLGLADNGVSVRDFALCHCGEATIIAISNCLSAFSNQYSAKPLYREGRHGREGIGESLLNSGSPLRPLCPVAVKRGFADCYFLATNSATPLPWTVS